MTPLSVGRPMKPPAGPLEVPGPYFDNHWFTCPTGVCDLLMACVWLSCPWCWNISRLSVLRGWICGAVRGAGGADGFVTEPLSLTPTVLSVFSLNYSLQILTSTLTVACMHDRAASPLWLKWQRTTWSHRGVRGSYRCTAACSVPALLVLVCVCSHLTHQKTRLATCFRGDISTG